jgi:hypothetical protein
MLPLEAKALLNEAALTVTDLALMLVSMGDPRPPDVIERGIYHAISSERSGERAQFVPWAVAGLLRCLVVMRRLDLGDAYQAHFLAHQSRLRFRRKPGVCYALDEIRPPEDHEAAARAHREAEHQRKGRARRFI